MRDLHGVTGQQNPHKESDCKRKALHDARSRMQSATWKQGAETLTENYEFEPEVISVDSYLGSFSMEGDILEDSADGGGGFVIPEHVTGGKGRRTRVYR